MPIRPRPVKLTCLACDTSCVYQHLSDAISIHIPTQCPHCRSTEVRRTPASTLEVAWAQLSGRYVQLP